MNSRIENRDGSLCSLRRIYDAVEDQGVVELYERLGIKSHVWGHELIFEKNQLFYLRPDLPHT